MTLTDPQPAGNDAKAVSAEAFYSGAVDRIMRFILVLGVLLVPVVWVRFSAVAAAGFLLGASVSYLNFYWLARAVHGLAARIVEAHSREKGGAVVARFLLRYILMGLAAYVTFKGWSVAFYGLLAGLCLPVAGFMGEAACEVYMALRRGL